ncbi:MAG: hypothetical protein HY748_09680 [Elusimicrobia bacterium]|nr:hypothetical protein [Elusimicrobiota bacterium]
MARMLLKVLPAALALAMAACDMGGGGDPTVPSVPGTGTCQSLGAHCERASDCCGTLACNESKVCSDGATCAPGGGHCQRHSDCCGASTCEGGVCSTSACVADGGHCQRSSDCCGSGACNSGICQSGSCVGAGAHCLRSADCCGGLVCGTNGVCR